jgi:hypothetical protein
MLAEDWCRDNLLTPMAPLRRAVAEKSGYSAGIGESTELLPLCSSSERTIGRNDDSLAVLPSRSVPTVEPPVDEPRTNVIVPSDAESSADDIEWIVPAFDRGAAGYSAQNVGSNEDPLWALWSDLVVASRTDGISLAPPLSRSSLAQLSRPVPGLVQSVRADDDV